MALLACPCRWNTRQSDHPVIAISIPRNSRTSVKGGRTLDDRGGRRRDGRRAGSPGLGRSQRGAVGGEDVGLAHEGELMEGPRANPVFIGNRQRGSSGPKGRRATATS